MMGLCDGNVGLGDLVFGGTNETLKPKNVLLRFYSEFYWIN